MFPDRPGLHERVGGCDARTQPAEVTRREVQPLQQHRLRDRRLLRLLRRTGAGAGSGSQRRPQPGHPGEAAGEGYGLTEIVTPSLALIGEAHLKSGNRITAQLVAQLCRPTLGGV